MTPNSLRPPPRDDDRGIASVLMLGAIVPLVVAAGSMLAVHVANQRETEDVEARARAASIAAGGAHDAIARLQGDPTFEGRYVLPLDGGAAVVDVTSWEADGADNDGNGRVDDAGESDLFGVASTGFLNFDLDVDGDVVADRGRNWREATEVILRRIQFDPAFEQSFYVDDPAATFDFNGNSFLISGFDVGIDGVPTLAETVQAIGTPGDPSAIAAQLSVMQWDNVVGDGGVPSVGESDAVDLGAMVETIVPFATQRFEAGESYSGDIGDLAAREPAVAYAPGGLTLSGSVTGFGILVVDGDLEILGSIEFAGMIVCTGSLLIRGGGSKEIRGALFTLGAVEHEAELSGSVLIQYSREALDAVALIASTFEVVAWGQT